MTSPAWLDGDLRGAPRSRSATNVLPLAILAIGALATLPFLILAALDPARREQANLIHWCLSAAVAFVVAAWAVPGTTGRTRTVRAAAAGVLGLWLLGNLAWALLPEINPQSLLASGDLFVLAILGPGLVILAVSIRGRLSAAAEAAVYLDSAIGFVTIATGLVLFLGPLAVTLSAPDMFLALAYPTIFLGMAGAGLVGVLAVGLPIAPRGAFLLLIGTGLVGAAYAGWVVPTATRTPAPVLADLAFSIGALVAAAGAVTWRDEPSADPRYLAVARVLSRAVGPTLAGFLFLGLLAPVPAELLPIVRVGVFGGGILFVTRQALLLRERSQMLDQVQALHAENDGLVADLRHELDERARMQAGLIEATRATAVGQLASGVAHQVNNPLSGVLGYAELLLADLPADDPRRADLEVIRDEALRARTIVWALRDFARPAGRQIHQTDLNALVERTVELIRYPASRDGVIIELTLGELPDLELDPQAIQQAILNVLTNAIQAMPSGGRVDIRTDVREDRVAVQVSDQGVGMDQVTMARAFEPFFAARSEPGAIGLGLSIARDIVERHGGSVALVSEPGAGTTVEIALPLAAPGPLDTVLPMQQPGPDEAPAR